MQLFIAWDGDHIGRQVGRASLADDAEGLRRISQAIDQGNQVWRSWVEQAGGSLISMGGDEGRAEVPADKLDELPAIREQYAGKVGSPVSVGVGLKLSEADKALVAAKLRGGDQIVFYTDEVEEQIEEARKKGEKTEEQKIADEYLTKGDRFWEDLQPHERDAETARVKGEIAGLEKLQYPLDGHHAGTPVRILGPAHFFEPYKSHPAGKGGGTAMMLESPEMGQFIGMATSVHVNGKPLVTAVPRLRTPKNPFPTFTKAAPGMNPGAFAGASRPSAPTVAKPVATQGDHEQGQVMHDLLESSANPAPPEQTHAAQDFERQLHDEAWKGEEEDMHASVASRQNLDQVKEQVYRALAALKVQGETLEQVKQVAPDAYKAMVALTQAVVGMARELTGGQPLQKAEQARKDRAHRLMQDVQAVLTDDLRKPEYQGSAHCLEGHCYVASEALYHLLGGKEAGWVPMMAHHEGGPHWWLRHVSGRVLDPTAGQFQTPVPYDQGKGKGFLTQFPSKRAKEVVERLLGLGAVKPAQVADVPMQKAELRYEDLVKHAPVELEHYSTTPGLKRVDVKHMGTGAPSAEYKQGVPDVGRAYYYRAGSQPEPLVLQTAKARYKTVIDPVKHKLYDVGVDPEGLRRQAQQKFLEGKGLETPEDTFLHLVKKRGFYGYHNSRSSLPHVVALFHPHPVREAKLGKADTPPTHRHVVLPVGTAAAKPRAGAVDAPASATHVKVQHSDGGTSWKQVRAGQIRSQDPSGHPVSSREPNSR